MKNYPGKYRDSFTNHEVRIPPLNNQEFNQESEDSAFFFFFVAQIFKPMFHIHPKLFFF